MESSVLYQSFLRDFNSHFLFCGQIENKSNFLPDQTVQTRKNSIKNKSCYLIWTYRKSVISDVHIPQELRIRSRGTERHSASD